MESVYRQSAEARIDEETRKELIRFFKTGKPYDCPCAKIRQRWVSWLEKQGEKPADKVEPKFKIGDWVVCNNGPHHIFQVIERSWPNAKYRNINGTEIFLNVNTLDKQYHLWTIQDAKNGDILAVEPIEENYQYPFIAIYKERGLDFFNSYCCISFNGKFHEADTGHSIDNIHPATTEQRDLLFSKMHEAGYEWDAEQKELKKIEQKPVNGEDYGIDGLWHAQNILEKTLGKVVGYQSDDGILEHECAISAVKKLYEQKPWKPSEEQLNALDNARHSNPFDVHILDTLFHDLKKLMEE